MKTQIVSNSNKNIGIIEKRFIIKNEQGLHARPAALFVQIANKFDAEITVKKGRRAVNGKSIMGIMMLAAERGSAISVRANGRDAAEALAELEKVISPC